MALASAQVLAELASTIRTRSQSNTRVDERAIDH
jgi:hypothetical protein